MNFKRMTDLDLKGKRVLIREDLNVPVKDGKVTSDARIRASLPTIRHAVEAGARVMLLSHLGRPTEGEYEEQYSLKPVAEHLGQLLGQEVPLAKDWLDGVDLEDGQVVLCENVRFNKGEKKDDEALAKRMAALCDIYVMDAFGTAHRAQASTHGVARFAPVACAGPLLANELDALGKALLEPAKPLVAIVGGSKVSTKLEVLDALADKVDQLIVGGGIAGDFPICVVPLIRQDLEKDARLWTYFCQISDSTTSYGSYSGAVPNEKITWGKLDTTSPKFIIESDATIVAPLIFSYVLAS